MLPEIEAFQKWLRRKAPNASTQIHYANDLDLFFTWLNKPVADVKLQDIDRYIEHCQQQKQAIATINRRLASLVSFYTFLADEAPALVCPVLPRRHAVCERDRLPRPVPEAGLRAFFAVIDTTPSPKGEPDHRGRDRAMFVLMLRCGLRIGEVASLELTDLYLDEPYPRLVAHGKGARERAVYLSPQAERALRAYLRERPASASEHVFLSYQLAGLSTTAIHKRLMIYRKAAAVSLTAHRLRHSFATDLLAAEVPVTSIQKLLGHRWLETTQIYVAANDRQVAQDYYAACARLEGWQ